MGRRYYRFLVIEPGDAEEIVLTVRATGGEGTADFVVFPYAVDINDRFIRSVRPAWIAGSLLFVIGSVSMVAGIASSKGRGAADGLEVDP
jgi:hypothetical protein